MDNKNIFKIFLPKRESIIDKDYLKRYYHAPHLSDGVICEICEDPPLHKSCFKTTKNALYIAHKNSIGTQLI